MTMKGQGRAWTGQGVCRLGATLEVSRQDAGQSREIFRAKP